MSVPAQVSTSSAPSLREFAALKLPRTWRRGAEQPGLGPPPTIWASWELASAGLDQISALLPTLERMVGGEAAGPIPLPVGYLARALGEAAHWMEAGHAGLAGKDEPGHSGTDALAAWSHAAQQALDQTACLLTCAERRLAAPPPAQADPDAPWALSQIAGAQAQVGVAGDTLAGLLPACSAIARRPRPMPELRGAAALLGMMLMLLLYGLALSDWLTAAAVLGTLVAAAIGWLCGWRVGLSGFRLEPRSPASDGQRR